MSKLMSNLLSLGKITRISNHEFMKLKEKYGINNANIQLGEDLTTDLGLHPCKQIILIENTSEQRPESYEEDHSTTFSFAHKKSHYIYHEQW